MSGARSVSFATHPLAPGVTLHVATSTRFKRARFVAFFEQPLTAATASEAALLARVLPRGTERYPQTLAFEQAQADLYGAQIDCGVLKVGDRHVFSADLTLPAERFVAEDRLYEQGLDLFFEMLARPATENGLLRERYVAQEAEELARTIESLIDNKMAYARWRCVEVMCEQEPYGVYSLGTPEQVRALDAAALTEAHRRLLAQSPVSIYAFGDFDADAIVAAIRERVAWPRAAEPAAIPPTLIDVAAPQPPRTLDEAQGLGQTWLVLGFRTGVDRSRPDYEAMVLLNALYGGSSQSRLFLNVRERASLAYAAYSSFDADKGILLAVAGIDLAQRERAQALMLEQLAELAEGRIDEDELRAAKAIVRTNLREREDSPGALILVHWLSRLAGRDADIERAVAAIDALTVDEVAAAARKVTLDTVYCLTPRPH